MKLLFLTTLLFAVFGQPFSVQARTLIFSSKKQAEEKCETVKAIAPVVVVSKSLTGTASKRAMFEELIKKSIEKKGTAVYLVGRKKTTEGQWVVKGMAILCLTKPKEKVEPANPSEPLPDSEPAKLQETQKETELPVLKEPIPDAKPESAPTAEPLKNKT